MKIKDIETIQPRRIYAQAEIRKVLEQTKDKSAEIIGITQVIEKNITVAYDVWIAYKKIK